jgi:ferric-dicitrate binding protein FerR (iron transport regulator)
MKITRALIEKFFQNQCTAEEASAVGKYLEQHPEELEAWLPEQEWQEFKPEGRLHPEHSNTMLNKVRRETKILRIRRYSAWAAAVALLLAAGGFWWQQQRQEGTLQPPLIASRQHQQPQDTVVKNTGTAIRHIILPDGSDVALEQHSSLRWAPGFSRTHRALSLDGAATFNVVKDEGRPFIVYSGNVATTVLGTAFRVSAYKGDKAVKVRLLAGKVMVKTTGAQAEKGIVYLTPGQECAFNEGQSSLTVYRYEPVLKSVKPEPLKGNIAENGEELLFTNVPLPQVLRKFETVYNINISYSPQQLKKYYFTGTISKKDAVHGILKTIAELNRLQLSQDSTGYHISR